MLARILSKYISRLKGNAYHIDRRIPDSYLFSLIVTRMMMKFRGFLSGVKHKGPLFIGRKVVLKSKSKLTMGAGVSIGNGCYIDALSAEGTEFGHNVSIGYSTRIECTGNLQTLGKGMRVGDNVGLGSNNFYGCAGGIVIGKDTIVGNFVSFHAENHIFSTTDKPIRLQGVTHQGIAVGSGCWIGAKATILDGAVIEDGCIIAAGALVRSGTYEKNGIYGGVPAKLIKYRD